MILDKSSVPTNDKYYEHSLVLVAARLCLTAARVGMCLVWIVGSIEANELLYAVGESRTRSFSVSLGLTCSDTPSGICEICGGSRRLVTYRLE